jgi:RNA polymerase sigma factor (sigma-70 family)
MADSSAISLTPRTGMRLLPRGDARLAKLAAAGDERAFAAIYDRYHQEIYRYCFAILGDADDAQDALQGTMASALRSLPGESRPIELRPWLYRVAHNESISIVRRRQPLAEAQEPDLPREPAVDAVFESRERLRTLVADLATLSERQRSALVMRELSGLSHEQIAAALGTSSGAARQVVYEARQALLELEEGRGMECERVRMALSDGDGRRLRARGVRAHLRGCQGCRDFQAGIDQRAADFELLVPPLGAIAASGVLATVLGGGSAGAGAGGLAAGGVGGGLLSAKALAVVAASAAVGVGAGTVGGVDLPGVGSSGGPEAESGREATPAAEDPTPGKAQTASDPAPAGAGARHEGPKSAGKGGPKQGGNGPPGDAPASPGAPASQGSAAGGASAAAPAGAGQPETPPGGAVATDRTGGQNAVPTTGPPEQATQGPPAQSNAGGVSDEHGKPEK